VALAVLEKKIFKDLASFCGFSLPVQKIYGIAEPFEQILKRPTQGTFLPQISFLGIIVSKKIFKEMLTRNTYVLPLHKVHSDLKISFLCVIVSEKKTFKELLMAKAFKKP
jgi:hypothetical protein